MFTEPALKAGEVVSVSDKSTQVHQHRLARRDFPCGAVDEYERPGTVDFLARADQLFAFVRDLL